MALRLRGERMFSQAVQAVRAHALAALLERLGEEGEVDEMVARLAADAARGSIAASQAGARIASKVLAGTPFQDRE
jgi:hypothetical protein